MRMPETGGKKVAPKASAAAKKPMRQVETSMSKKYKGTPKVSQTTIDNIKKLGMTAALKKAGSSKNVEYLEGVRRMYGAKRLATAQGATKPAAKKTFSPAQKTAMGMGVAKKAAAAQTKSPRATERTSESRAGVNRVSPRTITKGDQKKNLNPTNKEWWDRRK